jgi:hypothetical protein
LSEDGTEIDGDEGHADQATPGAVQSSTPTV